MNELSRIIPDAQMLLNEAIAHRDASASAP